jgi:5-hydroxyisourate hydrolase-like protein (transthyretin family)
MAVHRPPRRGIPWVPIGLGLLATAAIAGLMLTEPGHAARGAEPTARATAGFQTTEKLVLTVNLSSEGKEKPAGTLRVELLDPDGKVLRHAQQRVKPGEELAGRRFAFAPPKVAPEKVTVRCSFGGKDSDVPLKDILLVKAHETALSAGQELFPGSTAALRCEVHGVKSYTQTVPLPGASVAVRLRDDKGKAIDVYEGKAGTDGIAAVQFKVPDLTPGNYKLEVHTRSALGEETLSHDVKVKEAPKVLLVTDKPLYQPGQTMHLRALALSSFDLKPAKKAELTFEVEDGKGNKVFKKALETSEYGIASADFTLADEVNQGAYQIRATLGSHQTQKTVEVKRYVLPKFKMKLEADKRYYLPKETIKAELQVDYFFGKPVAGAKVEVKASTFDVKDRVFLTWKGKTDKNGHATFEVKLPDYFVGQPLAKGNALARLEAKITDTADHTETVGRTYPVSNQPIQVSLIPEGGKLVPGLENRVYAAALYPDGSPAQATVQLWAGKKAEGKPVATVKTNEAGLAEFRLTPKEKQFRASGWGARKVELLGGRVQQVGGQKSVFDVFAQAKDGKGNEATAKAELTSEPFGENVLLRLDKAIYAGGDTMAVDIVTSAGLPTVYLDVVRSGQVLLTRWLDVKDGKASQRLDLPEAAMGTLEVHAYQMLASGEIIRDSRVVYVQPADGLKVEVSADESVYRPGADGKITFAVTDREGKPTAAALGVIIVDEAVYALQEMQPGLEKVYFTLQKELLKPQGQVVYKPRDNLPALIQQPKLVDVQQQAAQVLLTAVQPKPPARWEVRPEIQRRQQIATQMRTIAWALYNYAQQGKPVFARDKKSGELAFREDLLKELVKAKRLNENQLKDPMGGTLTLEGLATLEKGFTARSLADTLTLTRMNTVVWNLTNYAAPHRKEWLEDGKWHFPEDALAKAAKARRLADFWLEDAWGKPIKLVSLKEKRKNRILTDLLDHHDLVSAGPDGKFGTKDDLRLETNNAWWLAQVWWLDGKYKENFDDPRIGRRRQILGNWRFERAAGRGGGFGGVPVPAAAPGGGFPVPDAAVPRDKAEAEGTGGASGGEAAPARVREYFPETMLWEPALITDERGHASLPLQFADSITTWRLTASASSAGGLLGGTTTPLRVFQDFFVEPDLPVALTRNDEVAFPVAVFNYLKTPQRVRLELQKDGWFELVDGLGFVREVELKPNEVKGVSFRIRATRVGDFPLNIRALGPKMSDAVRRNVRVEPDGKKVEEVVTDRLEGDIHHTITIPKEAIEGSEKLLVKVYPGVMSQVLEGTEGMLRLPGG